jgi:hypothetical protein
MILKREERNQLLDILVEIEHTDQPLILINTGEKLDKRRLFQFTFYLSPDHVN